MEKERAKKRTRRERKREEQSATNLLAVRTKAHSGCFGECIKRTYLTTLVVSIGYYFEQMQRVRLLQPSIVA